MKKRSNSTQTSSSRQHMKGMLATACMAGLFSISLFGACNTNTVEYLSSAGVVNKTTVTPIGGQVPMDILWVVDNSFSMCQEQEVLRENFSQFVGVLGSASLDFHIALTTTHAPESSATIEPVAREARLQSTPQPVPGNNQGCLRDDNGFGPLRESLDAAKRCLADESTAGNYEWTDAQIDCALQSPTKQGQTGCVASSSLPDRNGDERYDIFDLFPSSNAYRSIPKVLRAEDYRQANGALDEARLELDFSCMATVGTRGDGYEKGLRAAVNAVSPELTGSAVELATADMTADNHGFIRTDADFTLIFVTDENDCSHDGSVMELGNTCGSNICEYMNSSAVAAEDSALISVETLAEQLRENLATTKGLADVSELNEVGLSVSSINGTSRRYNEPFPTCGSGMNPEVIPACASALGEAYSGDRYERFMRQFRNFYPNSVLDGAADPEAARLDFTKYEQTGWMCTDSFAPALTAIAEFIVKPSGGCIDEPVYRCETDADCPAKLFSGQPGVCTPFPGIEGQSYCDSGVVLKIERDPKQEATVDDINGIEYCIPDSINQLESDNASCVIDPSRYTLGGCPASPGVQFQWVEAPEVVSNKLAGYTLETIFSITPE